MRIIIELEVEGDDEDIADAVDAALDAGVLQDAIKFYGAEDQVEVTSAMATFAPAEPKAVTG